jgi:Tol biopolymer transport system component/DNA-binding winged helix-turn-helix (wHTH) protein
VEKSIQNAQVIRFATFEADLRSGELRKSGVKLKFGGQPFQVLAILLEHPGSVVTREELQKRLWPETFVDVDHNLNTAVNKIREILGDSAENPRFVETLARRGYRFVAAVDGVSVAAVCAEAPSAGLALWTQSGQRRRALVFGAVMLLAGAGMLLYKRSRSHDPAPAVLRMLTRLTFDEGLQLGVTWSPDGRFIAYSSDRGGKFDIWVQQVSGGEPLRITKGPGQNWQPDWSPNGKYIAYRSEDGGGGLFVVPVLGGEGLQRKIASFGYYPRWSPDSSQILFRAALNLFTDWFYVVSLDGSKPRKVLTEFLAKHQAATRFAAWHPDGKRITVWLLGTDRGPAFWTVPVAGGEGVESQMDPEIIKQLGEVSPGGFDDWAVDLKLSWAPWGGVIYFERSSRGARNLWKMSVDPKTLRAIAIERLTTGPGLDTELALSPDGKRLAYTVESQRVRAWLFPFESAAGRITGAGQAVTSPGMSAWAHSLAPDGQKLVFNATRSGKLELWEKSLVDGREAPVPVPADDYIRHDAQWSPDGARLAYSRAKSIFTDEIQLVVWSAENNNEVPLTAADRLGKFVIGWSSDGKQLLVSQEGSNTHMMEIWLLPVNAAPHAEVAARKLISDPAYDLWQPHFSPDGRWLVFEAVSHSRNGPESTIYVTRADGGSWTRVTQGEHWDDKPRWSPDGKTIYFVSCVGGFFNVWGIRFDPSKGKPVGETFPVTAFENPGRMVPNHIPGVELELNRDKLVLTMEERSGSVWVLDNVDR